MQIFTLKSDSEAIKSSSSRVAEEAVGHTVRVIVVLSSFIILEINCPLLLNKFKFVSNSNIIIKNILIKIKKKQHVRNYVNDKNRIISFS